MNKAELAGVLADKVGVTKKQAEDLLDYLTDIITDTIKKGGEVTLTGFGTFSARVRKGREGVNPQNPSESITIPPTKVVKFKAGKTLKDALKASQQVAEPTPEPSTEM
jgi:DNA-binding protein HU-beta